MKTLKLLLLGVALFGCAPNVAPPVDAPKLPPKVESALPNMVMVGAKVEKLKETNVKLEEKLKTQNQTILEQKVAITNAIAQAEKLKERIMAKEALTELDAINLIEQLTKAGERNLFLELQNEELEKIRKEQDGMLVETRNTLNDAIYKLTQKEAEAATLRLQAENMTAIITQRNSEVANLQKQLAKSQKEAATAQVYRHWIIGLVVTFVAWLIIKNILMIYFPMTKFRI